VENLVFYPYRFRSILKKKLWGGRRLETFLGKKLPEHERVGESWDLSDREDAMSLVENGPHEGVTLRTLLEADRYGIMGRMPARLFPDRFPLLVKHIDAHQILSLQVHPDDDYAMERENGQWGKMEAWYIIHAEPHSFIYRGVLPGTDARLFDELIERGKVEECLHKMPVSDGDVIFVPPGCVHATGPGIVFCEVQQNSDLTYRITDWGRVDANGDKRELHPEQARDVIDWDLLEREGKGLTPTISDGPGREGLLLECPKFAIEKVALTAGHVSVADVKQRCHIVCVIDGHGAIVTPMAGVAPATIRKGETYLIPSALESYEITTPEAVTALRFYVPLEGD